jgi:hypothetical protein
VAKGDHRSAKEVAGLWKKQNRTCLPDKFQFLLFNIIFKIIPKQSPAMNILMAISTEVFPIAAVRRVIQVIAVLVVNGQELSLGWVKFPAASSANQSMKG